MVLNSPASSRRANLTGFCALYSSRNFFHRASRSVTTSFLIVAMIVSVISRADWEGGVVPPQSALEG